MDLHVVNGQLKAQECHSATLSIAKRTCASVDQICIHHNEAFA
jgi:hypothetical protein